MAVNQVGGINSVRIVVAGDANTGKSSLIATAISNNFPASVPPLLPPSRLPDNAFPDHVPITIIDTNAENNNRLEEELNRADAVVLTFACDQLQTIDRLATFWLPKLRNLDIDVPVIVVGCKMDLKDENQEPSMEQLISPIVQEFREIETCTECSALTNIQVLEVFFYAQRAVLYPTRALFDQETQTLSARCMKALKRIFILCDHDCDNALNDEELNNFQVKCFNAPLQVSELIGVKNVVRNTEPVGVNERGLTLAGFRYLHALFIERGRIETTWTVLRKFGYDNKLRITSDLPPIFRRAPDQGMELTKNAIDFLMGVFTTNDLDNDGVLHPQELSHLFSTAPESPWNEAPYNGAAASTELEGFLSMWALMTLLEPAKTVEYLRYLMYNGDATSALRVTRKRRLDRKKQQSDRNVIQCFVFGPKEAGKSALLSAFLGRPFSESHTSTTVDRYAVGYVRQPEREEKILVMREIPEDVTPKLLSSKESLAACDVAIFVYDSSDKKSWEKMSRLLVDVASHGEATGYQMPCLIVAAKDDLDTYSTAIPDSTKVSQDLGIDSPLPVSVKLGEFSHIFDRITRAAERPHMSVPETEAEKSRKQFNRRSLMAISVGAAVAVIGLAAFRVYAARKNSSS